MKYYKEKKEHTKLLDMLKKHFSQDEDEMYDEDMEEEGEDDGFGDPMKTFHQKNREYTSDDSSQMYDVNVPSDEDHYDTEDEDEDEEEEDDYGKHRASKADRKNLSIMMLSKKIGKNRNKKMHKMQKDSEY
jgi:hypothetical protein